MIKFRELYEIKNKNTPPDLEKYCDKINKLRKEEKEEYIKRVRQREKMKLSFFRRNRSVIFISCVIILIAFYVFSINNGNYDNKKMSDSNTENTNEIKKNNKNSSDKGKKGKLKAAKKHTKKAKKTKLKVGTIVYFSGSVQYKTSNSKTKKNKVAPGKAKSTKIKRKGKHKYHLIGIGSKSKIYGWVDEKYVKKL